MISPLPAEAKLKVIRPRLICGFLFLAVVGAPTLAQTPPPPATQAAPAPKPEEKPATQPAPADFLRLIDRLDAMNTLAADVERQRDGLTLTLELLRRQMNELIQQAGRQVPEGYEWDAASRQFKLTAPPAPAPAPAAAPAATPTKKDPTKESPKVGA